MLEAQIQARLERLRRLANGEEPEDNLAEQQQTEIYDLEADEINIIEDVWGLPINN